MKKLKKILLVGGLLVMLFTLSACNSGNSGVINEVQKENETEVVMKLFAQRNLFGEIQEKDFIDTGFVNLNFYLDGERIYIYELTSDWILDNGSFHKETYQQDTSDGIFKFKIKPGTYNLKIVDKRNSLEDFERKIVVGEETTILELDLGILDPGLIDIGEIELKKKKN